MAKMSAMDALEELLPGIEEFLVKALARERLAPATEKKRLFFIERLEIIKMPPSLPPARPTGLLPKKDGDGGDLESGIRDSYIAMQRALSRFCNQNSPSQINQNDGETYDSVEGDSPSAPPSHPPPPPPCTDRIPVTSITSNGVHAHEALPEEDDDIYEVPVGQEDSGMLSDEFESTSYESYDDEEEKLYENEDFNKTRTTAVVKRPKEDRVKTKKKKKVGSRNGSQEVIAKNLPNVIYCGEIAQKGKLSWTRRYAAIQDTKLLVFKSEKEAKPLVNVALPGYDAIYMDKEGKRNVVRLSQPGHETHWFSVDSKEKADKWVEMITSASQGGSGGSVQRSEGSLQDHPFLSRVSSENVSADQSSITNPSLSGSEGGSGDGTVGSLPISPKHSVDDLEKKLPLSKQKTAKPGVMDSMSKFFGTLGRNKGKTVTKVMTDFDKFEGDPEAVICGLLTARSEKTNKKWLRRWCSVKSGQMEIYNDNGEDTPEMTIVLTGCDIQNARVDKRQLAIRLVKEGKELITLDTADTLEQGKWLSVLIKESGCGPSRSTSSSMDYTYVDDDDGIDAPTAESEDIYDEVYDDKITAIQILTGRSGSLSGSSTSGSGGARVIDKKNITKVVENIPPPPLPTTAPPINRPRSRKSLSKDSERKDIKIAVNAAAAKKEENVVKAHAGPTIHVDKEILEQTENPILTELRKKRKERGSSELDDIREKISQSKRKLAQFKKKRAEVRSKKLCSIDVDEKLKLGRELRQMDREQDKLEAELSKYQDKENEIMKEERAALRSSLRGTSSTTSSSSRYSPRTTPVSSPKSTRISTTTTGSLSSASSWRHVDSPSKDTSIGVRGLAGSSSPTLSSKFGGVGSAARGPFASRYTDSFSKLSSNESSPTSSPSHSFSSKVTTVRTVTTGNGGKSATMTSYTAQRSQRLGLGPRSATLPSKLEMKGKPDGEDGPPSPRGGREKVQESLKLWESRSNTTSEC